MANNAAVEQQYRHFESKGALELGLGVDREDGNGGNGPLLLELGEFVEHVIAKPAALAAHHHEARGNRTHLRGGGGFSVMPVPLLLPRAPLLAAAPLTLALTDVAMNWTVFGGTSPTAVTW
jgi:hypothetical protein